MNHSILPALRFCALGLVIAAVPPEAHSQTQQTAPRQTLPITAAELAAFVNPIIKGQLEKEHIPGAVFVLVQKGRILYQRGYGFADLEKQKRVDPFHTIWRIGS